MSKLNVSQSYRKSAEKTKAVNKRLQAKKRRSKKSKQRTISESKY